MNGSYRVIWPRHLIEHDLAEFAVQAMQSGLGMASITAAMNEIDRLLAGNPLEQGESREGAERILIVSPLSVHYVIDEDNHLVVMVRVHYHPRSQREE
jgi:hypothetical protein